MRAALAVLRRWMVVGFASSLCWACAQNQRQPFVGASETWRSAPESPRTAPAAPKSRTWDLYPSIKSWPPLNPNPFVSRGHLPTQTVDVRADPASRALYLTLVTDSVFPTGSVLLEVPHTQNGTAYVMQKNATGWVFFELDESGSVRSSGDVPSCQGCHAQAPSDGVFGLPRDLPAAQ